MAWCQMFAVEEQGDALGGRRAAESKELLRWAEDLLSGRHLIRLPVS